ncbi:hypothetical protein VTK56DRAFT_9462 [Thermocarpiscus australiensis]
MPPALGFRRALITQGRRLPAPLNSPSICLFCSFSPAGRSRRKPAPSLTNTRRPQSTSTSTSTSSSSPPAEPPLSDPRRALQRALLDLQSHAPGYVNLARLQLALRNLSQPPGRESVRVTFLAAAMTDSDGSASSAGHHHTATRLLRLALADPLRPAEAWEARLEAHDISRRPLVVRVGGGGGAEEKGEGVEEKEGIAKGEGGRLTPVREHGIPELRVSSPWLNEGNLEVLVAEADLAAAAAAAAAAQDGGVQAVEDAVLVPTVDVAATTAGHAAPVATPVHMAVLVGNGVLGAASILSLPILEGGEVITAVVNFTKLGKQDLADCPLVRVNVDAASEGLELFRADVSNAMKFEALWSEANVGRISEWLRANVLSSGEGVTKAPIRNLISSLLQNARAAVQEGESRDLSAELNAKISPDAIARLDQALSEWAQNAHEELQHRLDVAFAGRPWSKLGWWKLFWRADDVGMVTSEMVASRFLPEAEKGIIYLAGRIQEAGVVDGQQGQALYPGPAVRQLAARSHGEATAAPSTVEKWPMHIPFTRNCLQEKTVPALQALAQRLVLQSASLAGLTSALAGLSYLSGLGAYECGAIAALGLVLSFRRLQKKWDTAREYWEGEVREEGRKAIRASEASVAEVLNRAGKSRGPQGDRTAHLEELRKAEEIIKRAEDALARMK